jgi:hypothetical protein
LLSSYDNNPGLNDGGARWRPRQTSYTVVGVETQDPEPDGEPLARDETEPPAPDEEELQRRLEQQLREIRVQDLLLESVASLLNLAARRIAKADERDLEQGRVGIEAVRAVLDLLDEGPRAQVREALSQVQMLYVRETKGDGDGDPATPPGPQSGPPPSGEAKGTEPPPRLWTPPGSA